MKPLRLLDTNTAQSVWLDPVGKEYPTWLLSPAGRDRLSDRLLASPNPYWETVTRASRLLAPDADTTCVIIGAGLGAIAVPLAKLRPRATVWAFEPALPSFLHLCTHAHLNGLANLRPERLALSGAPGLLPLYLPDVLDSGTATLRPSVTARAVDVVRTVRLAEHDAARTRIDLLLCHVPDQTAAILRGAKEALLHWHPPLLLEIPDPKRRGRGVEAAQADALTMVRAELGYELAEIFPEHYLAAPPKRLRSALRRSRE